MKVFLLLFFLLLFFFFNIFNLVYKAIIALVFPGRHVECSRYRHESSRQCGSMSGKSFSESVQQRPSAVFSEFLPSRPDNQLRRSHWFIFFAFIFLLLTVYFCCETFVVYLCSTFSHHFKELNFFTLLKIFMNS